MLSPVRLSSVCLSPVTLVRATQAVQIFGNISTAFGTLAIRGHAWPQVKCGRADLRSFLDLKMMKSNYKPNTGPNSNPNANPNTKQTLILI